MSCSIPAAEGLAEALDLYILTANAEQVSSLKSLTSSDDDTPRKGLDTALSNKPLTRFSVASDPEAGVGSFDRSKLVWTVVKNKSELIGQRIGSLDLDRRFDLQVWWFEVRSVVIKYLCVHTPPYIVQVLAFKRTPKTRGVDNQPKELRLSDIELQRDDQLIFVAGMVVRWWECDGFVCISNTHPYNNKTTHNRPYV